MPRRGEISMGVLLLASQIFATGLDNIPPVTLLTILAQVAIFLGFIPALDNYSIGDICVLPARIFRLKEWKRLILPTFVHADDMHLYYNMISFLWKGRRLERRLGSWYFAYLLAVFSILTNVTLVSLSLFADEMWDMNFSRQCAVGFSGVIFALKVLTNHYYPHEDAFMFGWLPISSQYACWAELLLIQMLVPNASFVGHLAGIVVGLAYVKGPLKWLMDSLFQIVTPLFGSAHDNEYPRQDDHYQPRYASPYSDQYQSRNHDRYTGGLSDEEQMRRAMDESLRDYGRYSNVPSAPPYNAWDRNRLYPDLG